MSLTSINTQNPLDVVIVGGGLSGLLVARKINNTKLDGGRRLNWKLFEASSRIGGRLQNDDTSKIDLGGAWIWPSRQPQIMEELVNPPSSLGTKTFPQPGPGYESYTRIVGGAVEFVNKIYNELLTSKDETTENVHVRTDSPVTAIKRNADKSITVELKNGEIVKASHVVLAAPPKQLSLKVSFEPKLPIAKSNAMSSSETWMAGVTKVALVYRGSPAFWPLIVNVAGRMLPTGHRRPAFQVYDGSPLSSSTSSERVSVLTFFTLASLGSNGNDDEMLARDCAAQISDSLSTNVIREVPILAKYIKSFDEFYVKRWPNEEYISNDPNPMDITPHPHPRSELARSEWAGTLLFAGTETDQSSPGLMEGAVGAANRVANELAEKLSLTLS